MSNRQLPIILGADRELWDGDEVRLKVPDMRQGLKVLHNEALPAGIPHIITIWISTLTLVRSCISVDAKKHRTAWQLIKRRTFCAKKAGQQLKWMENYAPELVQTILLHQNSTTDMINCAKLVRCVADAGGISESDYVLLPDAAKMALLKSKPSCGQQGSMARRSFLC